MIGSKLKNFSTENNPIHIYRLIHPSNYTPKHRDWLRTLDRSRPILETLRLQAAPSYSCVCHSCAHTCAQMESKREFTARRNNTRSATILFNRGDPKTIFASKNFARDFITVLAQTRVQRDGNSGEKFYTYLCLMKKR